MCRVGALLALWCVSLGAQPSYRVQVAEPEVWRGLLSAVGIDPTTEPAPFRIVVGGDQELGIVPTGEKVRVASVVDARDPGLSRQGRR